MSEWLSGPVTISSFTFPFSIRRLLIEFLLPVAAYLLAAFLLTIVIRRIVRRNVQEKDREQRLIRLTRRIVRILVVLGILLSGISLFGTGVYKALGDFFVVLNKPFFTSGNTKISIITLILIVPIFAVASWTGKLVSASLNSRSLKRFGLDAEQSFTMGRLFRYLSMVLVFIIGMSIIGIDLSAIGVLFGVLGIGIGFGLQSVIADFFAGITLISMGLIKEGDRITISGFDGVIRNIRLINTELITFENETLIIPNRQLTGGPIHNYSYKDRRVIIVNEVDVSYKSDLDVVIDVLKEVGSANPWSIKESLPLVRVKTFAESGITMQLRTWIRDVVDRPEAVSWNNLEIWRAFLNNNVEIPFPQRVVHHPPEFSPPAEGIESTRGQPENPDGSNFSEK